MEQNKRWLSMIERYGGEEEAKAEMRRRAEKSSRNLGGRGGFASLSQEERIKISRKGGQSGKRKR